MPRRDVRYTINSESELPGLVEWAKDMVRRGLAAGPVLAVLTRPQRTLEQNDKFHAICGDLAKQCDWMGRTLKTESWKVLLVSGHAIAEGQGADVVPGLEGEFVNLRESTARMSKERMSSLIEYSLAYGDGRQVTWSEKSKREVAT